MNQQPSYLHSRIYRPKWLIFLKILLILGLLTIPVILIMVIFAPFISDRNRNKYETSYLLPEGFGQADVEAIIQKMRGDREFSFYFMVLSPAHIKKATEETYAILNANRSQAALAERMNEMHAEVHRLAVAFSAFEYPPGFTSSPLVYRELLTPLVDFVYREFTLTVLGACYKSNYDLKFRFQWDEFVLQAAGQLQKLLAEMQPASRQAVFGWETDP